MKKRVLSINEMNKSSEDSFKFPKNEFKKNSKLNEGLDGIENVKRLDDQLVNLLNQQITNELESSQIYRAMSCWLDNKGWIDASEKYFNDADEELVHMRKIYNYLFSKNCVAEVRSVSAPAQSFEDIRDVVTKSLDHEMTVTANWTKISELAKQLGDDTTHTFAQWFLTEQTEEETKFRNILFKMNLDMPRWKIDELFK